MRKIIVFASLLALTGCGTMDFFSSAPPVYVVFFPDRQTTLTADGADIVRHAATDAKLKGMEMVQ
ncbi:MAG TPA: hypothetical protein VGH02_06640, partial [Rhizomicrobium sp.]